MVDPGDGSAVGTPKKSVLVVDDNDSLRGVIVKILQRKGYGVVTAASGSEAIAAVENASFDLVLLDVVMPHMDGPATAMALRAIRPTLRIAFMSGAETSAKIVAELGALFLTKPFTPSSLLAVVEKSLLV